MQNRTQVIAPAALVILLSSCGPIRSTSTPLDVDQQAPAFSLPNQAGREVSLASLSAPGPAVLVFNRGHR